MNLTRIVFIGLTLLTLTVHATALPVRFFFRDAVPVIIPLDEPATGCKMSGQIVHPVERPATRVVWFSERTCGKTRFAVSFISGEISAPDNIIHKGEKFNVTPAQVQILDAYNL